jgi:hypothetical protein
MLKTLHEKVKGSRYELRTEERSGVRQRMNENEDVYA